MARFYPTILLYAIGMALLAIGAIAAIYGPVEFYSFYLFSEGGRFYYEGFGFGSLMFTIITWQIIAYYLIALIFIPLGYAHIRLRGWARTLSLSLLWCWLVLGIPLLLFGITLFSFKDLPPIFALMVVTVLGFSYLLLPWLLIRFYQSEKVIQTFKSRDTNSYWVETIPIPVLVLSALCILYVIALHLPIFFNGIFPFFGIWFTGLEGMFINEIFILSLVWLIWGILLSKKWAWWGSLAYFSVLTLTTIITFLKTSYPELLSLIKFPPREMEILQGIPLQGYHFIIIFGIPLVLTMGVILSSKRHFGSGERGTQDRSEER